mgnify:CR=1 FL=1
MNDLAFVIIPFDKTESSFQNLITATRTLLNHQQGPIQFYNLLEAIFRLNLDNESFSALNTAIRKKILSGNFSRSPYDIAISLAHFSRQIKKHNLAEDR